MTATTAEIGDDAARVDVRFATARIHRLVIRSTGADGKPVRTSVLVRGPHGGFAPMYALQIGIQTKTEHAYELPAGRYRITLLAPGLAPVDAHMIDLSADRTETVRLGKGARVTFEVRRKGAPLTGAAVTLVRPDGVRLGPGDSILEFVQAPRYWRTGPDGTAVLPAVPHGEYTVEVDGHARGTITVGTQALRRVVEAK